MSISDTVMDMIALNDGEELVIQPPTGQGWCIDNIHAGDYFNLSLIKSDTPLSFVINHAAGSLTNLGIEIDNTTYLIVANTGGNDGTLYAYSGCRIM